MSRAPGSARLAPFLPEHLVRRLAGGPAPPRPVADELPAALLLTDVSGFTALTERLQSRGREGAEEVARVVNMAFRPAIAAIQGEGGSIVSFGGDALFSIFQGPRDVRRAVDAAEAIRRSLRELGAVPTSAGRVALRVSQVVHHGVARGLHLAAGGERCYVVAGRSVAELARLEARAPAGRVTVSREAARCLRRAPAGRREDPGPAGARRRATPVAAYVPAWLRGLQRLEGDYRQVTALFLETRGDGLEELQAFFERLSAALSRYGVSLLKTDLSPSGARWLCAAGLPVAHEDDAGRAALVALEVRDGSPPGRVRAALHAGTVASVLMGSASRRSFDVMGDAVNTAARALGLARWGEVLTTRGTRLFLPDVTASPRGSHRVKGKAAPVGLFRLGSWRRVAPAPTTSTPFCGRERELARLTAALRAAASGRGRVMSICGDAGIGKSRLADEAARAAEGMGFSVHRARATSLGNGPFQAIAALARDALGISPDAGASATRRRVTAASRRLGLTRVDRDHLERVMGIEREGSPAVRLPASAARRNDLMAVAALVAALSRARPRLLVLDDLHWVEASSRDAVEAIARVAPRLRLAMLLLHRPSVPEREPYAPPEPARAMRVGPLGAAAALRLGETHLAGLDGNARREVLARAAGNPFYVEELARHLRSAPGGAAGAREIPGTIEAVVSARLGELSPEARRVAEAVAVVGSEVPRRLMGAVGESGGAAAIEELAARGVVARAGGGVAYLHTVTRDVVYQSILESRRKCLHARVARAVAAAPRDDAGHHLLLGFHHERSGAHRWAAADYLRAARAARHGYHLEEAERAYRAHLGLVTEPAASAVEARLDLAKWVLWTRGRHREAEVELRLAIRGARSLRHRGHEVNALIVLVQVLLEQQDPDAALAAARRAAQVAREARSPKLLGRAAACLGSVAHGRGRAREAARLLERAVDLAVRVRGASDEEVALGTLAQIEIDLGRFDEARAHSERAIALSRSQGLLDNEVAWTVTLSNALSNLGHVRRAAALDERSLRIARRLGWRRAEETLLGNLALRHFETDPAAARRMLLRAIVLARDLEDPRAVSRHEGNLGRIEALDGNLGAARRLLWRAIRGGRRCEDRLPVCHFLAALADVERRALRLADADRLSREALGALGSGGADLLLAEALMTRARVLMDLGRDPTQVAAQAREILDRCAPGPRSEAGLAWRGLEAAMGRWAAARRTTR